MLGKLPVSGRPTILITVGQGPVVLAVGAGGVVWTLIYPLNPKQTKKTKSKIAEMVPFR